MQIERDTQQKTLSNAQCGPGRESTSFNSGLSPPGCWLRLEPQVSGASQTRCAVKEVYRAFDWILGYSIEELEREGSTAQFSSAVTKDNGGQHHFQ